MLGHPKQSCAINDGVSSLVTVSVETTHYVQLFDPPYVLFRGQHHITELCFLCASLGLRLISSTSA